MHKHTTRTPHLNARKAALSALFAVFNKKQQPERSFEKATQDLLPQDRAFAYTLLQETLRYSLWFDSISAKLMTKPFAAHSMEQQILRLGLCQLLCLNGIKPYAAVNTTVDLMKAYKHHKYAGVVNGVLRKVLRTHEKTPFIPNPVKALPTWFYEKIKRDATLNKIITPLAQSLLQPAPTDFYAYNTEPTPANAPYCSQKTQPLLTGGYRLSEQKLEVLAPQLQQQQVYIQDHSAQWPAYLLSKHIPTSQQNGMVLDMCAAPGGKTRQLLHLLPQAKILAADSNPHRLKTLIQNLEKQKRKPQILTVDGSKPFLKQETLDAILLDAPCSATGTNRRHPEVLHLRNPRSVRNLCTLQQQMLKNAAAMLKKGGVLAYAVCSLLPEEGEEQHIWVTKNIPQLAPLKIIVPTPKGNGAWHPTPNALRLTPIESTGDGFYIALYKKT